MTMKDKYYTPEIEEFHVGFECQVVQEARWVDVESMDIEGLAYFERRLNEDSCRVKYLDREDIESLGFEKDLGERYRKTVDSNLNYNIIEIAPYYTMRQDERDNLVRIFFILQTNDFEQLARSEMFRGNIKNKSELKRILKQIGV